MFLKNLNFFLFLSLMTVGAAHEVTIERQDGTQNDADNNKDSDDGKRKMKYIFDQDAAAAECEKTQRENDEELFRLFCVNRVQSFKLCAISCSNALHFEGTVGKCDPSRCSWYGQQFVNSKGKKISMSNIAQDKVTLFGIVPLWDAQAQYFYELAEYVKELEYDNVEAIIMPLYVEDKAPVTIEPLEDGPNVHILKKVYDKDLPTHPIMKFLPSLKHVSGFGSFDFYMDRPVFFAINHDGSIVERMVAPTKDTLMDAVQKYSKGYNSRTTTAEM